MALVALGSFGAVISYFKSGSHIALIGMTGGIVSFLILASVIVLSYQPRLRNVIPEKGWISPKLKQVAAHLDLYRQSKKTIFLSIILSLVFHLIVVISRLVLLEAFGEHCDVFQLAMVVMISNILGMLPVTLNGYGILDGSFVFLMSRLSVSYSVALTVMVVYRFLGIMVSFIGGLLYLSIRETETRRTLSVTGH
jgi:uncharacterized protein (TIRG00374 family)